MEPRYQELVGQLSNVIPVIALALIVKLNQFVQSDKEALHRGFPHPRRVSSATSAAGR